MPLTNDQHQGGSPREVTVHVPDELALAPLARSLVATLPQPAFVALHGDLGAGKTTFVKAIASAAGIDPAAHADDIARVIELLAAFVLSLDVGDTFHQSL